MTQPGLFPFISPALAPLYAAPNISEDDMAVADYAALDSLHGALATLTAMQSLAHAPAAAALAVSAEQLRGEIARMSLARVEIVS